MIIRRYNDKDFEFISDLFYETVHTVNARDYSAEQLNVWTENSDNLKTRRKDLLKQHTLIAEIEGVIVGFGSIDKSGWLDLLFVCKDYQNQGVATALCNELEKGFFVIKTYASITAKPFFERRSYVVVKTQEVERCGVKLKNYEMRKKNAT